MGPPECPTPSPAKELLDIKAIIIIDVLIDWFTQ